MKINGIIILIVTVLVLAFSISGKKKNNKDNSIMVFAAAGLTDVMAEIADSFESNYHIKVKTNMASSGTLARQIEQGALADIYISASKKWSDYIDSLDVSNNTLKSTIASNKLVLIAPIHSNLKLDCIDSTLNIKYLIGSERISMGDPAHVPAGKYGQQSLMHYGWYDKIQSQLLPAKDVRSALMVVEMSEAPLGIVYKTDALKSSKVKIIAQFPDVSHSPIEIIASVMNEKASAKQFYEYLQSNQAKLLLKKYGFSELH